MEVPDEKHLKNAFPGAQQLQQLLWPYPGILRVSSTPGAGGTSYRGGLQARADGGS